MTVEPGDLIWETKVTDAGAVRPAVGTRVRVRYTRVLAEDSLVTRAEDF